MAERPRPYKSYTITTEKGNIHARFYGAGDEYALAIHGFAQDGSYFETLSQQFPKLTICAIDLPWHGKTDWQGDNFTLRDFESIIKFLDTQGPIHLIGFSMGTRIAIALSQLYPRLTKTMTLLSPNGIAGPYHYLTEYFPSSWRKRMPDLLRNPNWALTAGRFLYERRLLKRFPYFFMQKHIKNPSNRERLFKCWESLPNFSVTLGANIATPTRFIVGKRDDLVGVDAVRRFASILKDQKIYEIDRGHDVLPLPPGLDLF